MGNDGAERSETQSSQLRELDARIRTARAATKPVSRGQGHKFNLASMAWRMVFELAAAMAVGGAMGWGLDSLFGTVPLFLIVFWLLGFAAGIRMVMRSAKELQDYQAAEAAREKQAPDGSAPDGRGREGS